MLTSFFYRIGLWESVAGTIAQEPAITVTTKPMMDRLTIAVAENETQTERIIRAIKGEM